MPSTANTAPVPRLGQRYAFVVVGVIFFCLLFSAGLRSTPSVLLDPLQQAFGWSRSIISLAAAIGIFFYGMVGPFAAPPPRLFFFRKGRPLRGPPKAPLGAPPRGAVSPGPQARSHPARRLYD